VAPELQRGGPIDTKWIVGTTFPGVNTDGDDHIFGDLGNDWLLTQEQLAPIVAEARLRWSRQSVPTRWCRWKDRG
jgi:hypothetical protein